MIKSTYVLSALLFVLVVASDVKLYAQSTPGTLTFSALAVAQTGSYGSKHTLAVWLEDSVGTFIKTKMQYGSDVDHLATWTGKSNSSKIDALTGATISNYSSPIAFTWNGTDVNGNVVVDGKYKVWLELAWNKNKTIGLGKSLESFTFIKDSIGSTVTPTNTYYTSVSVTWTPTIITSIDSKQNALSSKLRVFPNPTSGNVNIDISKLNADAIITIKNTMGAIMLQQNITKDSYDVQSFDLSNYAAGVYFVSVQTKKDVIAYKITVTK